MQDTLSASPVNWEASISELLAEISTVQDEMFEVLQSRRDRMAGGQLEDAAEIQAKEEGLMARLEACHQRRRELLAQASQQGLPVESLSQLAAQTSNQETPAVTEQLGQVSSRMKLLQHSSLTNWVVAQRSLLHLSQLLEILAGGGRIQPTYGDGPSSSARGALVDRAA